MGLMGWLHFAERHSRKILSPALSSFLEIAAAPR
jgi:hypothetical protein